MKKLLLISLLFAVMYSCNTGTNEFLVKGKLENANGKMVFLSEFTETGPITVDSILVDDKGEFKLKGNTSYPKFFMLRTSPNQGITLIIDSADVLKVSGDFEDLATTYKIDGSDDMNLIKELDDQLQLSMSLIDSLGKIYQQFETENGVDSAKKSELDNEFINIFDAQKEFSRAFIDKNSSSFASMMALSQQIAPRVPVFNVTEDIAYFEKVDKALFEKYPNSKDVQSLHKFMEQIKNPPQQQQQAATSFGVGDEVPDITEKNPEGKELSLSSLRGNYVLLDFWAGWCRPCRMESPNLVANYNKYHKKGFQIFQVSLDQKKEIWTEAIEKDELGKWNHVSDLGFWQSKHARAYNIMSIPASYLLGPDGKVVGINLRGAQLGAKLMEIYGF
ncbi:MAG: TlpA disulfide reductase family protein [Bacteroidota bacterium]